MDQNILRLEVRDFLANHLKMVMGINEGEGYPNTSLMHYAVTDDLRVFFGTKRGFGKYSAIIKNPKISFVVVEEGIDPLKVVDARGIARELSVEEALKAHEHFKAANQAKWYVEGANDFVMFEIALTSLRWLDATSGELKVTPLELQ